MFAFCSIIFPLSLESRVPDRLTKCEMSFISASILVLRKDLLTS
jgi:hypothetical protein